MREETGEVQWAVLPRGDGARWSGMYVTMNPKGKIALSRTTWERFGAPEAVLIKYDALNSRLALCPVDPKKANAYPIRIYQTNGGRIIRAYRLLTEFGIQPKETIQFDQPRLNLDGQLILDLRSISISRRAHSVSRRKPTPSLADEIDRKENIRRIVGGQE